MYHPSSRRMNYPLQAAGMRVGVCPIRRRKRRGIEPRDSKRLVGPIAKWLIIRLCLQVQEFAARLVPSTGLAGSRCLCAIRRADGWFFDSPQAHHQYYLAGFNLDRDVQHLWATCGVDISLDPFFVCD